jgi:hypothetical protein
MEKVVRLLERHFLVEAFDQLGKQAAHQLNNIHPNLIDLTNSQDH